MIEPWLRGPLEGVHPVASHLLYTFQQAREELTRCCAGLDGEHLWRSVNGAASVGFHLRHIAGSVDRLATYLAGGLLTEEQLQFLRAESTPGAASAAELLQDLEAVFARVEAQVRAIPAEQYLDFRGVGRKALPTTVAGLIIHLSEHTQRHLGQALAIAKVSAAR